MHLLKLRSPRKDQAFEGRNSGEIILTKDHPRSLQNMTLRAPFRSEPGFISSLNYKSDVEFYVGFMDTPGLSPRDYVLRVKIRPKRQLE